MRTGEGEVRRETPEWGVLGAPVASGASESGAAPVAELGEVPVYDDRTASLVWIDVFGRALHRTAWADGATQSWSLPETIGCHALCDDPEVALVALHGGLSSLDLRSGTLTPLVAAPYDTAHERFNDGRCDAAGTLWVGTIRLPGSDRPNGSGHFYRYSRGVLSAEIAGVTVANGIAFAPDDRTLYLADRVNARLLRYPFDPATGRAGEPELFARLDPASIPDGAAVDTEGGYWIAMFGEGEVRRYTAEGVLDRVLALPVSRPTMCAFAGPGLDTLVVTTARWGLDAEQFAAEPLAGRVLTLDPGAHGRPEPRYRDH